MVRAYCTQHTQYIQLPTVDSPRWVCTVGAANWWVGSAYPRRSVQILNPSSGGWTLSTHLGHVRRTDPPKTGEGRRPHYPPAPFFVGPPVGPNPLGEAQWRSNFESQLGLPLGRITK